MKQNIRYITITLLSMLILIFLIISYHSFISADSRTSSSTQKAVQNDTTDSINRTAINHDTELKDTIDTYLVENGIAQDQIGIAIFDIDNEQSYTWNADAYLTSASLYKVPLAMLYYDALQKDEIKKEDTLTYCTDCYEEGGPIGYTYDIHDEISLDELLYDMIVYSDNTAAHILFEHLGGWNSYRSMIQKYTTHELLDAYIDDNVFPADFAMDILSYLYAHQDIYHDLIQHMKLVFPDDYLNRNIDADIAQKYGSYGTQRNAMGIVYGDHPYLIVVLCALGEDGIVICGDINEIVYTQWNG